MLEDEGTGSTPASPAPDLAQRSFQRCLSLDSFSATPLLRSLGTVSIVRTDAFLSVRGTADFLPQHELEFLKLAKGRPSDAILIGGADHIFNVFQPELGHAHRVVTQTIDWVQGVL